MYNIEIISEMLVLKRLNYLLLIYFTSLKKLVCIISLKRIHNCQSANYKYFHASIKSGQLLEEKNVLFTLHFFSNAFFSFFFCLDVSWSKIFYENETLTVIMFLLDLRNCVKPRKRKEKIKNQRLVHRHSKY